MKISSIISGKRVETISASASIHDVVNTLNSHHIGALVVSSDGKRIDGIVSERDVVRAMPGKLDQLIGMHVRDIMTVEVHTCTPDTTVAELMKMMTEHRIRHVPVVDGEGALISHFYCLLWEAFHFYFWKLSPIDSPATISISLPQ